jgi:hypothetical protein
MAVADFWWLPYTVDARGPALGQHCNFSAFAGRGIVPEYESLTTVGHSGTAILASWKGIIVGLNVATKGALERGRSSRQALQF